MVAYRFALVGVAAALLSESVEAAKQCRPRYSSAAISSGSASTDYSAPSTTVTKITQNTFSATATVINSGSSSVPMESLGTTLGTSSTSDSNTTLDTTSIIPEPSSTSESATSTSAPVEVPTTTSATIPIATATSETTASSEPTCSSTVGTENLGDPGFEAQSGNSFAPWTFTSTSSKPLNGGSIAHSGSWLISLSGDEGATLDVSQTFEPALCPGNYQFLFHYANNGYPSAVPQVQLLNEGTVIAQYVGNQLPYGGSWSEGSMLFNQVSQDITSVRFSLTAVGGNDGDYVNLDDFSFIRT